MTQQEKTQITFNLTFYPFFKNVRKILKELHLLLTPEQLHKTVFSEVAIIGFKNAKSLKDQLVRTGLPQLDTAIYIKALSKETFNILKGLLDCNSK